MYSSGTNPTDGGFMLKVGDWVKIIVQDWEKVPVGTVLQIIEINEDFSPSFFNVEIDGNKYPYYEDELTLATELEKALA